MENDVAIKKNEKFSLLIWTNILHSQYIFPKYIGDEKWKIQNVYMLNKKQYMNGI